jgi:hypothetical protein
LTLQKENREKTYPTLKSYPFQAQLDPQQESKMATRVVTHLTYHNSYMPLLALLLLVSYTILVQTLRYRRRAAIKAPFANGTRPLSSMTTKEAHHIISQLQLLEFPFSFNKARKMALLKVRAFWQTVSYL